MVKFQNGEKTKCDNSQNAKTVKRQECKNGENAIIWKRWKCKNVKNYQS